MSEMILIALLLFAAFCIGVLGWAVRFMGGLLHQADSRNAANMRDLLDRFMARSLDDKVTADVRREPPIAELMEAEARRLEGEQEARIYGPEDREQSV